jgi:biotin operon repressor
MLMRRADRLYVIIEILRREGRPVTAEAIATELEVSKRTVYRDVADLIASRVPISGEAGIGYVLESGYYLPPLMLTEDEIDALVLGVEYVKSRGEHEICVALDRAGGQGCGIFVSLQKPPAGCGDGGSCDCGEAGATEPAFHVPWYAARFADPDNDRPLVPAERNNVESVSVILSGERAPVDRHLFCVHDSSSILRAHASALTLFGENDVAML